VEDAPFSLASSPTASQPCDLSSLRIWLKPSSPPAHRKPPRSRHASKLPLERNKHNRRPPAIIFQALVDGESGWDTHRRCERLLRTRVSHHERRSPRRPSVLTRRLERRRRSSGCAVQLMGRHTDRGLLLDWRRRSLHRTAVPVVAAVATVGARGHGGLRWW
jgi:hypothetical protein